MSFRIRVPTLTSVILAIAFLAGGAGAQPGAVISYSKINSSTMAGLGVPLDNGDEFGDAVAGLGDLDGPGPSVAALAVGAISDDDGGDHRGAVYILFLGASGNVLSQQKISSTQGNFTGVLDYNDEFGGAIASLGDLDGPGPSAGAIAVGAVNDDDGGLDRGAIYILFLSSAGRVLSQQKISNLQGNFTGALDDGDEFGGALATLGDLDGAGPSTAALAVGAVYDDDGGLERGAVYILFLNTSGTVQSSTKISSTSLSMIGALGDDDNFGEDVASLGDLDGAGPSVRALAVGAVGDDDGGTAHGAVYILFLNAAGSVLSRQKISDTQGLFTAPLAADDNLGSAVAALGDLDGPGPSVAALAVGAGSRDGLGLDRGATYILFLTAAGTVSSYQEISSTSGNFDGVLDDSDEFGSGLAALGDIDGGGVGAMAMACGVGYDDDGGLDRGAVYVMILANSALVGVGDLPIAGRDAGLGLARPSVFAHRTTVPFHLSAAGRVRIEIWDASGRLVRRLVDEDRGPGDHQVIWDGSDGAGRASSPGAYFMRMSVDGRSLAGGTKALLLR
jgi:hypothetical protein